MALVRLWSGFGVALVWLWCGLEVALGWLCTPEYMPSICLLYGFAVALGGLSAQGSGFKVQGSMWEQSASRASTPSRSARGSETRPVCSVRAAIWRRTDALVLAVNAGSMNENAQRCAAPGTPDMEQHGHCGVECSDWWD
jgi:hypothetical protein